MFCGQCGAHIRDGDKFCRNCGAKAPVNTDTASEQKVEQSGNTPAQDIRNNAPGVGGQTGYAPPQYIPAPMWQPYYPYVQPQKTPAQKQEEAKKTNAFAIVGFIFGLAAMLLYYTYANVYYELSITDGRGNSLSTWVLFEIFFVSAGLAFGIVGLVKARKYRRSGLVFGILGVAFSALTLLLLCLSSLILTSAV